jgi:hypothetical protein
MHVSAEFLIQKPASNQSWGIADLMATSALQRRQSDAAPAIARLWREMCRCVRGHGKLRLMSGENQSRRGAPPANRTNENVSDFVYHSRDSQGETKIKSMKITRA